MRTRIILVLGFISCSTVYTFYFLYNNAVDPRPAALTGQQLCPSFELKGLEEGISTRSPYWSRLRHGALYTQTADLAREEAPFAPTALDVGAYEGPFLTRLDWIQTKVATDRQSRPAVWKHMRGIAFVGGEFLTLDFGTAFDLVLCTQVVEHLADENVSQFVQKSSSPRQKNFEGWLTLTKKEATNHRS